MDIIVPCIRWVPILSAKILRLFTQTRAVNLPDDVIMDIFSRLPAELVFQCCHQCRTLRALTSSQPFIDMHLSRATSVSVSIQAFVKGSPLYFIDDRNKKIVRKRMPIGLESHSPLVLVYSYTGLLLFQNAFVSIIWNPVTQEEVVLNKPCGSTARGLFFDPKTREFKVLYLQRVGLSFQFIIYSLRTKARRKTAQFSNSGWHKAPITVNGALHWMVDDFIYQPTKGSAILAFDMDSENVRTMTRPADKYDWRTNNIFVHLLEIGGCLCYGDTSSYPNMDIWVLEDYAEEHWIKKHVISLEFLGRQPDLPFWVPTIVTDNDDLLLGDGDHMYRYNLKQQMLRKFKLYIPNLFMFAVHKTSLVSLHIV